jgi:hypothetical protein
MKKIIMLGVIFQLFGCASSESIRLRDLAEEQLEKYDKAELIVDYDLINSPLPAGKSRDIATEAQWKAAEPRCMKSLRDSFATMKLHENNGSIDKFLTIEADKIDNKFSSCLLDYNLKGTIRVPVGGENLTLPSAFLGWYQAALAYGNAQLKVNEERNYFARSRTTYYSPMPNNYSYSINPSVITVRPYLRRDGTFVSPHIRTVPNGTCLDNLGGCR